MRRVTFKYALGSDFIEKLKLLHDIGLDRTEPVTVRGVEVSPRDVVAAVVPDPITMGDKMVGRAIVGTWVIGSKDGKPREVFLYQMADAAETLRTTGSQVVGWQTGFNPVLAMELLANGHLVRVRGAGPGGLRRGPVPGTHGSLRHPSRHGRDGARGASAYLDGPFDHPPASA